MRQSVYLADDTDKEFEYGARMRFPMDYAEWTGPQGSTFSEDYVSSVTKINGHAAFSKDNLKPYSLKAAIGKYQSDYFVFPRNRVVWGWQVQVLVAHLATEWERRRRLNICNPLTAPPEQYCRIIESLVEKEPATTDSEAREIIISSPNIITESSLEKEPLSMDSTVSEFTHGSPAMLTEPVTEPTTPLSPDLMETAGDCYSSKLPDVNIPNHLPLAEYCLEKTAQWADKVSLIDGVTGREYTFGEVEVTSRRVAAGLAKLGVKKGGVIALVLSNCVEFVLVFLGGGFLGGGFL